MEAAQVLGALAALFLVSGGVSWWWAGRRGIDAARLDRRSRDPRIDRATAEFRAGPHRQPTDSAGGYGGPV